MNTAQPFIDPHKVKKVLDANAIFTPHANQLKVLQDSHKYRTVIAGRRFGKSSMAINYALAWIMNLPKQVVWIVLPQFNQAKSIYWVDPDISSFFMPYVQSGLLKKNDSELSLYCHKTQSQLILKGSDNSNSLRGSGLDLIIFDEVASIKTEAFNIISPALTDSPHHKVLYIGTPDGFNHFHDLALRGDHNSLIEKAGKNITPHEDWMTYRFTSYDNLTWHEGSMERIAFVNNLNQERQKYEELGELDWFEQEYLGSFRKRAGAVHKHFDRSIHVVDAMPLPVEWPRSRGWDWGSSHPTASLRIAIDNDDNWFIETSYKQKDEYLANHAIAVKQQDMEYLKNLENGIETATDPIPGYADPSGRQWITELNKLGFSIRAAKRSEKTEKKTWIEMGIDKLNSKIAPKKGHTVYFPNGGVMVDAPSFFILNRPENQALISELETLSYKKTSEGLQRTEIDDTQDAAGHYDLHAALRYFAISDGTSTQFQWLQENKPIKKIDVLTATPKVDLRDEEIRKQLEKEADLLIMKQAMQNRRDNW